MKLHLPASLLSALLAAAPAVHAAVTDITPTVNPTEIAPSNQPQGTTTATNQYYVLTQDVTIKTKATGSTMAFISSGTQPTYIFTSKTPDNPETSGIDERYGLTFSGIDGTTGVPDTHRVFRDISLHIEDLESLVLDGNAASNAAGYTSAPGAFLSASKVSNSVVKNVGKVLFADTWSQTWSVSNRGGVLSITNPNNTFSFEDCGSVTFRNTCAIQIKNTEVAETIQVAGGAIYAGVNANGLNFKNNGAVLFDRSSVNAVEVDTTTYGGAICIYSGDVNFTGNDSVTFTSCAARHGSSSSYGGAISLHNGIEINRWRNVLSLIDNKDVTFSNNSASGTGASHKGHTSGGAIAAWHDDRILIKNNSGAVTFSGNYAYNEGGAIFAKAAVKVDGKMYGPEITISGNNSVKFTGNYVGRGQGGQTNVYGGAVYAASGMTLANNGTVEFSGNYLTTSNRYTGYGAAIYIGAELSDASLVIAGNDRVVFGNNYVKEYSNSISGNCHMGSIYGENGDAENVFSTSSSSTSTIEFRDAVYLMGDLDINSSYLDIDNVKQDATGKVVFAGQYVQGYLQNQMSFDSLYAGKTDISRTSTLGGDVTVHGGSLQIVEDAIVNIGGMLDIGGKLSVDGQQVNTARVDVASGKLNVGATTDASGTGLIRLETNGSLNLTGDAVVTAGQVTLDGATLDMSGTAKLTATAGDLTASNAAGITMTGGALSIGSKELTLDTGAEMNLSGSAAVTAGQVTLTDATLKMQGGTLTATGGDLVVTKSSALADEGAAEKTYDVAISGGTLDIGTKTLALGSGTSMELSGGQVTAGQVKLENAALDMAGDAELTASGQVTLDGANLTMEGGTLDASAQGMAVQAAGIKMTGGTLKNGEHALTLGSGTSMELSGSAAVTAGQVTLTDATLKMQGGTLTAKSGDLVVAKTSPEVALADEGAAEKTYDVSVTGGTLDIGGQTLELGSGTSMELSGGQVTAGQVKLENAALDMAGDAKLTASGQVTLENAALDMAGDAELTASGQVTLDGANLTMEGGTLDASAQGMAVQAAGIKMTGGTLNNGEHALELGSGTSLELSGSAAVTAGQVTLTDATLKMQGGTLTAKSGDLVVAKTSPEVALVDEGAAEKTYDVSVTGGTLDIGGQTLELGSGTSMELSGGQVTAGQVKLDAATLEMAGTAKLTATSGDLSVLNAGGISMTGGTLDIGSNKLELGTGAEMDVSGGQVSADQVALTGAKLMIGGEAQVDALGGIEAQKAELVMQGGSLNAGTLELVDATLQMDAGVLDASTGGVRLSDSASLVLNGGSLNVGENDIELGADMKLSLGESALVSAGKITVRESATFSVSAASSGKKQAPLAQTLTPVDNMDPTLQGAMLSADLELMGGSTYDATGGSVSLGGHELTLSTSDASKINLVLTLDSLSDPDAQIIIFSDVAMVNFLFNHEGAPVVAGEDGNVSVSASNYFDNDWKDDYYINFDKAAGLVYLSSELPSDPSEPGATPGTPAVPEPSSTALGLMALAGLAMRRRRK